MPDAVRISGLDGLLDKMRALPEKPLRNALTRSLRKGANVVRNAARQNVQPMDDPMTPAMIWKNVATASMKRSIAQSQGADVGMRVGVQGGARLKKGPLPLPGNNTTAWRLLEFGSSKMRARPFLRPAMNENINSVFETIASAMNTEFDKEIAKL